jgi:SAM-dependent methyltransferase
MLLYSELAEHYFAIENHTRNIRQDITFVKTLIPVGRSVRLLDLGCGTGEHLALFAREGYECVGIDSSKEMLDVAKMRNAEGKISYVQTSVADFDYFEEFDIITSFFGSLDYLLTDEEVDAVMWNTWRALKNGGLAVFELWNAAPILMIAKKELGIVSTTEKKHLRIERERGFELIQKDPAIVDVTYRYHVTENGSLRMLEDTHRMRAFTLDEIKLFIAKNGFRLKSYYANAQKDGYSPTSVRTVVVIEK